MLMPSRNLLPLARPFTQHLLAVHKVALLNLVLPQIIRPVFERARASGIVAFINLRWARRVLQLPVFCHAAVKPSRVALGTVATNFAGGVGFLLLLLLLLLLF